jgi:hypothetical protein
VVVFTNSLDLVRFLFFFASAVWVAAIVVATREATIFHVSYRVLHGAATLDDTLHDVAWASSSLPTVESEMYTPMGELVLLARPQCHRPCSCFDLHRAAVPGTSRCPRGAANIRRDNSIRPKYQQKKNFKDLTWEHSKVEDIPDLKGYISQVLWGTPSCRSAR